MSDSQHVERVKSELKEAGISGLSLHKSTSQYLHRVIHPDEHIMAAVMGRHKESEGIFGLVEAMLVATDKRVLYIDHQPGYTSMDEITYEVVSGVNVSTTAIYASLTLYTKVANYELSFAKPFCVRRFADYIEGRRIDNEKSQSSEKTQHETVIDQDALAFLNEHETGVISSIERTGTVSGAVIYYTMHNERPYFMTKVGTRKASNILGNRNIALTVFDENKLQTVQLQGIVEPESDEKIKRKVLDSIIRPRTYEDGSHLPPVMRKSGDQFVTFRITPTQFSYTDFKKR